MINTLDGFTILRFAKAFKSGGGVETHLSDLDQKLLRRNKITIIRMYLEKESDVGITKTEEIGQGSLVEISMPASVGAMQSSSNKHKINQSKMISFLKTIFREVVVYNPFLYRVFFRDYLKKNYLRPGLFEIKNAGEKVRSIHQEYNVDLLVMHHVSSIDSGEIIEEAKKLGIPYIFHNCFSNAILTNISVREQISNAACIAGMTDLGLPKRLKDQFHNVSSGIDTDAFNPDLARLPDIETNLPIIFFPARITRDKGQADLIEAYVRLRSEGLHARIVFAGRTDSAEYEEELKELVRKNGLTDEALFIGQLNREELRDWYGISSILAYSSYHQEGLPTVLLDAQAMKVPPVAYIVGGTPDTLQDGKTGFLVSKGDINAFTRKLRELLVNEERRSKMGEEGRRFVLKNFSLEALAERHEKLYLSVIKNNRL